MKTFIQTLSILPAFSSLLLVSNPVAADSPLSEETATVMDQIVLQGIEDKLYPGGVLILGSGDSTIYQKAYGHQTFDETAAPMELDTIFDMASVSKVAATAMMALSLIDQGKLDPDEKVSAYIEGFSANEKESVMVRDLLTHTSGLKAYESWSTIEKNRPETSSHAEATVEHYAGLTTRYEPRCDYTYSCLNFQTTAWINEKVSGQDMDTYLKKNIWNPLGMNDTGYMIEEAKWDRIAPTHRDAEGHINRTEIHDPLARYYISEGHMPGNAGLFSTGPDMAAFCRMVLHDGVADDGESAVLSPLILRTATSVQTPFTIDERRGFGFDIYESEDYIGQNNTIPGHYVVGHTGYTGTLFLIDQHSDRYMVFLTNRTWPADETSTDQSPSITPVRKALWKEFRSTFPGDNRLLSSLEDENTSSESVTAVTP